MTPMKESGNKDLQFQWGKKRGIGGAKRDVQFYESFKFDGVEYNLYDSVYLYNKDEPEPYVGKIIKIWEHSDHRRKVKILWFFSPLEIQNYLGNYKPLENEIFLGSGEGVGLTNINQLEAVAGKCFVIYISQDKRYPQPSKNELEKADYICRSSFDVGNLKITKELAEKIAGIEVKYLLNLKEDANQLTVSGADADGSFNCKKKFATLSCHPMKLASFKDHGDHDLVQENEEKSQLSNDKDHIRSEDRPRKKMKMDDLVNHSDGPYKSYDRSRKVNKRSEGGDSVCHPSQMHLDSERLKIATKKANSDECMQRSSTLVEKDKKPAFGIVEVTRRPEAESQDRSKWFSLSWDTKVQKADEQGKLVFFDCLDPSYTSSDVEDIVYHTCDEHCTAKVIAQVTFQNSNYGRAYAIFQTKEAADLVTFKINKGCLMQSNGWPLTCCKGLLKVPPKSQKLVGHLVIDKVKLQMQREEMKKAVSTSHCSQPNTIEYEMAMEWLLLQEKAAICYKRLMKGQSEEMKQAIKKLRNK